jgi:rfaE bifunctional protein nucleotidyltransferase chain/domain
MKTVVFRRKIKLLEELAEVLEALRQKGKRIVHCHGVFDLLHPGHVYHLSAAKKQGDVLVVTVTPDIYVGKGPGRPVFNQQLRAETLSAIQYVDYVAINKWPTAVNTIKLLKPHVYMKGSEYAAPEKDLTGGIIAEEEAVRSAGGRVVFTNEITFSSTEILNKHFDVFSSEVKHFLQEFKQKYSASDIIDLFKGVKSTKVLVMGETIIDEYLYCKAIGKPPKEAILSTKYISTESFAGGVLAVANHIAGFCDEVHLVSCLGTLDSRKDYVLKHLKPNITTRFFYQPNSYTITKKRFVDPDFLTKMFEISYLNDVAVLEELSNEIGGYLETILNDYDLVLIADYGHGLIGKDLIKLLCERSKFLAVNTQTNSMNFGFNPITRYPRADYICIDEIELRLATADKLSPAKDLLSSVAEKMGCKKAVVTRGHHGSVAYEPGNGFYESPVFSNKVVDRIGAGDAYLAITAPCAASGINSEILCFLGNVAGAIKVATVCNRTPIESVQLFKFVTTLLKW